MRILEKKSMCSMAVADAVTFCSGIRHMASAPIGGMDLAVEMGLVRGAHISGQV